MTFPKLKRRAGDSHKGDYGRVLVIGGSLGMTGSVAMAGKACLRSGAGLVTIATPSECQSTVATFEPSLMTRGLPVDPAGRLGPASLKAVADLLEAADCVAIGPGLGRSEGIVELVVRLYSTLSATMVVDADALNALAAQPQTLSDPPGTRILTPHPGEFRRLVNQPAEDRLEMEDQARRFAAQCGCILVLKGHQTLVTDGTRDYRNSTGNPGMATGGSGDVLTGVIAGTVAQGYTPWEAATLGCHVHGLAGDLAAHRLGEISLIASDLLEFLPAAFLKLSH